MLLIKKIKCKPNFQTVIFQTKTVVPITKCSQEVLKTNKPTEQTNKK